MSDYRVIDIETVPDHSAFTPNPPRYRLTPAAHISTEHRANKGEWPPPAGVVEEPVFLPPHAQRVVAISWVDMTSEDGKWYHLADVHSYCDWGDLDNQVELDIRERVLIQKFVTAQNADKACLVTWNGRQFDLPVLNLRALKHGIASPYYYSERDVRYRYTEAGHCDLMDALSDYGAARSLKLGDAARLVGLPGKVSDVDGKQVETMWRESRGTIKHRAMASVGRYCLTDAVQTAVLFLRSRYHRGMIDSGEHDQALATFANNQTINEAFSIMIDWNCLRMSR